MLVCQVPEIIENTEVADSLGTPSAIRLRVVFMLCLTVSARSDCQSTARSRLCCTHGRLHMPPPVVLHTWKAPRSAFRSRTGIVRLAECDVMLLCIQACPGKE